MPWWSWLLTGIAIGAWIVWAIYRWIAWFSDAQIHLDQLTRKEEFKKYPFITLTIFLLANIIKPFAKKRRRK